MTQGKDQENMGGMLSFISKIANMPSPEIAFKELKRTNDILERLQPDLSKLANTMNNMDLRDIRNLTSAMQNIDVAKMLLALNEANSTIKLLYNKLWGKG